MAKSGSNLMEVARRCSVSESTVSRVLNSSKHGRFSVSAEVRDRILKVARELRYRPSMAARNMAVSKTNLVAVLGIGGFWSDQVGPHEQAVGALAKKLDGAGYEICLQVVSLRHGAFDLPALRVDGVVAVGPRNLADIQQLEEGDVPYISLDGAVGPHGLSVHPDDAGGTRLALNHLVQLGHKRIAYLDHPSVAASHPSVFVRREAFKKTAEELGVGVPFLDVSQLPDDVAWDSYYEPFLRSAISRGRATAVLAYSHYGALSLLRTAHDMGLKVPDDFSLICFNNEPIITRAIPSLTAVDVPSVAMGQATAELLLAQMSGEEPAAGKSVTLAESLVVRESTAPPRNSSRS